MSDNNSQAEIANQEELKTRKRIARSGAGDQSQVDSAPSPKDIAWKSADENVRDRADRPTEE